LLRLTIPETQELIQTRIMCDKYWIQPEYTSYSLTCSPYGNYSIGEDIILRKLVLNSLPIVQRRLCMPHLWRSPVCCTFNSNNCVLMKAYMYRVAVLATKVYSDTRFCFTACLYGREPVISQCPQCTDNSDVVAST